MSNPTITNCDLGMVTIGDYETQDELLTFAAADTFVAGTVLARRSVALAVTGSAFVGTGTGTISLATVVGGPVVPLVGAYTLKCTAAVANGGVFSLFDPNGQLVASGLTLTPGALGTTVLKAAGLEFSITDATDFAVGDTATLTVAADGKLVPFDPAGAGGVQRPIAVLQYEVTKAASGDLRITPVVSGRVDASRLVIDAGGSLTSAHLDALRAAGIVAMPVQQLSTLDNQ